MSVKEGKSRSSENRLLSLIEVTQRFGFYTSKVDKCAVSANGLLCLLMLTAFRVL